MSTVESKERATTVPEYPDHPPLSRREAEAQVRPEPTAETATIVAQQLGRSFGDHHAVRDATFSVAEGEMFGLIGPSGSGKTTLIKLLVGLLKPTSGKLEVLGAEPAHFQGKHRRQIGYMAQGFVLYPSLTVEQNARFCAGLYGMGWLHRRRRIRTVLKGLELWDARSRLAQNISGGMQRRLSLACSLLHKPRLLFVDEPSAGLDPLLRTRVWEQLEELRSGGTTIVVTTQNLDDAELCDRVAFIRAGRLMKPGTPRELKARALGGEAIDIESPLLRSEHIEELEASPDVRAVRPTSWGAVRVIVPDAGEATGPITEWLRQRGLGDAAVRTHEPTFDEAFLALVEQPIEGGE